MAHYSVISRTAYPFFGEKPEIYNTSPIEVSASTAKEAAKLAIEKQRRDWEKYGAPGELGTFRYAVIGDRGYKGAPTVEIVDVTVKAATVHVTDVETA